MFDTFEGELGCPFCGYLLQEFQTKSFVRLLKWIKQGETLPKDSGIEITKGRISVYTSCKGCGKWVEAWAVIDEGRFVRLEKE